MRSLTRSFASRLAALEELEAQADAKRGDQPDLPDLATKDDAWVVWEAVLGVRDGHLKMELTEALGPIRLARFPPFGWRHAHVAAYWDEVVRRATPFVDAADKPLIFLAAWEVDEAITAIDADRCIVSHHYQMVDGTYIPSGHSLWERYDARPVDEDLRDTCAAVTKAAYFAAQQQRFPQAVMDVGMTTPAAWRQWLVSIGGTTT